MAERSRSTSSRSAGAGGTRRPIADAAPVQRSRRRGATAVAERSGGTKGSGASAPSGGGSKGRRTPAAEPATGMARLAVRPSSTGPKVRLGILWFFVALAAVTAGRWPTAILWGLVAALAARELLVVWWPYAGGGSRPDPEARPSAAVVGVAVVLTVLVPAAAALGTGFAGGVLLLVVLGLAAVSIAGRVGAAGLTSGEASALAVAVLLPAVPAAAVVLVVGAHLWAGLFLVAAVSLYDAGCFIGGADSSSLLEGPVTGVIGVLAVTFTMAMFQAPPFDSASAAVVGGVCVLACPIGQWVASAFLPTVDAPCRAVRRLDTYLLTAPVFLVAAWTLA
ncbi:hypothetical protein [Dermatobacter hominis]|uniref:hypothetical protein n=1 Tax=Dermatobacter hominis TaxID=2884263 RepID=UPI001D11D9E6|nr:hypothetical protein [Dermatobacter hominis]UDY34009.1 hypothetical protein LH044_11695 [Dermatobacter hominis]